jgi:hypothetical protein
MKTKKNEEEKFDIDLGDDFNDALKRLLRIKVKPMKRQK